MKLIEVYTRDENVYFEFSKHSEVYSIEKMKMKYKNVVLKETLNESCFKAQCCYEIIVDWYSFHFKVFLDENDKMNNITLYDDTFKLHCPEIMDICFFDLVMIETFLFLKRGHSMFHTNCTCTDPDKISRLEQHFAVYSHHANYRHKQLGFKNRSFMLDSQDTYCKVAGSKQMRSIYDISMELGVSDIQCGEILLCLNKVNITQTTLRMNCLEALLHYGVFELKSQILDQQRPLVATQFVYSSLCCEPLQIQNIDDLMHAIKLYDPEPYLWKFEQQSKDEIYLYNSIQYMFNLNILKQAMIECQKGNIRVIIQYKKNGISSKLICNQEIEMVTFFYCDLKLERRLNLKLDCDVKLLWQRPNSYGKIEKRLKTIPHTKFIPLKKKC